MILSPYKVTFQLKKDNFKLITFILAENASDAGRRVVAYQQPLAKGVSAVSARKQKMSECAFFKKFGREETEKYFGLKHNDT
jgi:hypothetical protein